MNLGMYFRKNARIVFTDGKETIGFVETYTPAFDTEAELFDEIGIKDSPDYPCFLGVSAEEIESIEIIE
ncbi:hypothetical protein [Enterococcus diestrammenae]|uniref:hypothetical protein n=1 Tax=Enterococcus diestrammenae TaxID=1155073 RepID=UPI00195B6C33